jgi:hypothetical protein
LNSASGEGRKEQNMRRILSGVVLVAAVVAVSAAAPVGRRPPEKLPMPTDWRPVLTHKLPLFGHRNWIVIADSAYPAQSRGGIETLATGADQFTVVHAVLGSLAATKHVKPVVYLDAELPHVSEKDAPGIGAYREQLKKLLGDRPVQSLPHEQIIDKLDTAAAKFNVLILKTNLALPYTSVFVQLDCGYWNPDAEKRLRQAIGAPDKK